MLESQKNKKTVFSIKNKQDDFLYSAYILPFSDIQMFYWRIPFSGKNSLQHQKMLWNLIQEETIWWAMCVCSLSVLSLAHPPMTDEQVALFSHFYHLPLPTLTQGKVKHVQVTSPLILDITIKYKLGKIQYIILSSRTITFEGRWIYWKLLKILQWRLENVAQNWDI